MALSLDAGAHWAGPEAAAELADLRAKAAKYVRICEALAKRCTCREVAGDNPQCELLAELKRQRAKGAKPLADEVMGEKDAPLNG